VNEPKGRQEIREYADVAGLFANNAKAGATNFRVIGGTGKSAKPDRFMLF
jgi:hypothetical protein